MSTFVPLPSSWTRYWQVCWKGGGGPPSATETAWDWQFIIPEYEVAQEYGYRARVVYRERCPRDEVLEEYKNWRATLIPLLAVPVFQPFAAKPVFWVSGAAPWFSSPFSQLMAAGGGVLPVASTAMIASA